jgi:hypothetical protein
MSDLWVIVEGIMVLACIIIADLEPVDGHIHIGGRSSAKMSLAGNQAHLVMEQEKHNPLKPWLSHPFFLWTMTGWNRIIPCFPIAQFGHQ